MSKNMSKYRHEIICDPLVFEIRKMGHKAVMLILVLGLGLWFVWLSTKTKYLVLRLVMDII